jgi:hypothetical protein
METYSNAHHAHTRTSHLTKLYSDAKKSALINIEVQPSATQQFSALHRKYRIQKDRLITWGLAWSDDERGPDGNIDESVARAGLTETVDSVLRNIKEVTDEAERIKAASVPGLVNKGGDNKLAQPFDEARYEDLLRDLTTSIDTLYDLSRSRKALARGEHPTFNTIPEERPDEKPTTSKSASLHKKLFRSTSYASSEATLVNPPPFSRPSLSPYAGLPPQIDVSALRLPEEGPPPYESIGVPSTTRLVGRLVRAKASESVQNATGSSAAEVPVLVEYANFDTTYRDTGVPPPLQRLGSLANFFQPMRPESQTNLSLLGYFEDFQEPRIGLVYDLPYAIQNRLQGTVESAAQTLAPISLLKLVQKSNKPQKPGNDVIVPSLEDRFCIALRLVEQLHAFHGREIAHGNINSSSIIFTTTDSESPSSRSKQLRSPLWSAFDLFSKCSVEGVTRTANLNIYRHPEDHPQSPGRSTSTDIKFDMYGLAVILLEIGLWTPIGELYKSKYTLADFKLRLEKLWIPKLASKCGSAYMRAVQACVAAADDLDLGDSMPIIESAYELLLQNLRRCCVLDENASLDMFSLAEFPPEPAAPVMPSAVKRKPLPTAKMLPSRLHSNPKDLRRTLSEPVTDADGCTGFSAQATLSAPFNPSELSRQPSVLGNISREDTLSSPLPRFTSPPSFKEYKQKITLIQQKWREYRARCIEAEVIRAEERTRALAEIENDNERAAKPKRKEFPHLPLPQSVLEEWHSKTSIQLAKLVERALKGSPESSSIALTAYGETPETARPTYLVCCTSTARVKHVLKRHFKFDSSMCDLRVKKDEIRRCRRSRRDKQVSEAQRSMAPGYGDIWAKAANPDYQEKPLCGASIGAFRDDEHLPPVSFGGIVVVDGVSYGMSVHHMLEAEDEEDEESNPEEDDDSDTSSVRSFDNISLSSESDDESTVRPPSTVPDLVTTSDGHDGDCPGIVPGDYEEIAITQPALDDAIDLDLHVDEDEDDSDSGVDEDHLLSYKLGQVHASSGLKRTATSLEGGFKSISQSMPQEIDWALFELVPPRAHPYNIVKGGVKYCTAIKGKGQDTCPVAIRSSTELPCAKVHCLGRTSGLGSGTISTSMELVKIHGRSTFSASWTVDGDFGVGGDSGAWVISNDDGRVCGHVVASRRGRTYICPMDLLLDDIKSTLGATEVSLPAVTSLDDDDRVEEQAEHQALRDAVRSLHLADSESGGVALTGSTMRPSSSRRHFAHPVGVAG